MGNSPELGEWNNGAAVPLSRAGGCSWHCMTVIKREEFPISYKYILKNKNEEVVPENGADRLMSLDSSAKKPTSMILAADGSFRVCTSHKFL